MTFPFDESAIHNLAPDDKSIKAAKGLARTGKWVTLGESENALWGECQGSGKKPYQTRADLTGGPSFKCSCPSRKFPCKHSLALFLLRAQEADAFTQKEMPEWVREWIEARADRAEKKQEKAQKKQEEAQNEDPARKQKRVETRWKKTQNAAQELQTWLHDQIQRGLAAAGEQDVAQWETLAARMVDAQANGLANMVRDAIAALYAGHVPLLRQLGRMQLACDAIVQAAPDAVDAGLQTLAGWPVEKAEVLAQAQVQNGADNGVNNSVNDGSKKQVLQQDGQWLVLAVALQPLDGNLTERRVWLQALENGKPNGQRALILEHSWGNTGFEQTWVATTVVDATLAFYAGGDGLRALVAEHRGLAVDADGQPPVAQVQAALQAPPEQEWQAAAQRVAQYPWCGAQPLCCADAVLVAPEVSGEANRTEAAQWTLQWTLHWAGRVLPVRLPEDDGWDVLALTGGAAATVFGEWNGVRFVPLAVYAAQGCWHAQQVVASAAVGAPDNGKRNVPPYWQTLQSVAIVGTERQTVQPEQLAQLAEQHAVPSEVAACMQTALAQAPDAAHGVLRAAGVLAVCERTAWQGATADAASAEKVAQDAAPAETSPALHDEQRLRYLRWLLDTSGENGVPRTRALVLDAIATAGKRVPFALLPALLAHGVQSRAIRPSIEKVMGARGRWLAQHNAAWKFAADGVVMSSGNSSDDELEARNTEVWEYGSLRQRTDFLMAERAHKPAQARERLDAVFKTLPAAERAKLLEALAVGLSAADEAWISQQLQDRSGEVCAVAWSLLTRLNAVLYAEDGSYTAHAQRAIARVQTWLDGGLDDGGAEVAVGGVDNARPEKAGKGFLGKLAAVVTGKVAGKNANTTEESTVAWTLRPPEDAEQLSSETKKDIEKACKADGVQLKKPKHENKMGEQAWLLYQMVRQVPLQWWTDATGASPAALLRWAEKSDWTVPLVRGWYAQLEHNTVPAWCHAFISNRPKKVLNVSPAEVLQLLPLNEQEPLFVQRLESAKRKEILPALQELAQAYQPHQTSERLQQGAEMLPPQLSKAVLQSIQTLLKDREYVQHWELRYLLPELVASLHMEVLKDPTDVEQMLTRRAGADDDNSSDKLDETLAQCKQLIACRLAFANM